MSARDTLGPLVGWVPPREWMARTYRPEDGGVPSLRWRSNPLNKWSSWGRTKPGCDPRLIEVQLVLSDGGRPLMLSVMRAMELIEDAGGSLRTSDTGTSIRSLAPLLLERVQALLIAHIGGTILTSKRDHRGYFWSDGNSEVRGGAVTLPPADAPRPPPVHKAADATPEPLEAPEDPEEGIANAIRDDSARMLERLAGGLRQTGGPRMLRIAGAYIEANRKVIGMLGVADEEDRGRRAHLREVALGQPGDGDGEVGDDVELDDIVRRVGRRGRQRYGHGDAMPRRGNPQDQVVAMVAEQTRAHQIQAYSVALRNAEHGNDPALTARVRAELNALLPAEPATTPPPPTFPVPPEDEDNDVPPLPRTDVRTLPND